MAIRFRKDFPDAVVFEERDGLYWLRRSDLWRFEATMGIEYACTTVGFDMDEASAQAISLLHRGVRVGLRRDGMVRMLRPPTTPRCVEPRTSPVFLVPELLLDQPELERLESSLGRRGCHFKACYERWRSAFLRDERDRPTIFVVRLTDTMYEVDWRFTELSEASFQGLALATHHFGRRIACRLIISKARNRVPHNRALEQPEIYGQLGFAL